MTDHIIPGGQWGTVESDYEIGLYVFSLPPHPSEKTYPNVPSYNGQTFQYRQPHDPHTLWYWWTNLTYFLRYGWAHANLEKLTDSVLPSYRDRLLHSTGFSDSLVEALSTFASPFLESRFITRPFTTEQVQARARAKYGANLGVMSGLDALQIMEDAERERERNVLFTGGMATIFNRMLTSRPQHITTKLNTSVWGLRKNETTWTVAYSLTPSYGKEPEMVLSEFDEVVVATPWHTLDLIIQPIVEVPEVSWEEMYVTIFVSPRKLDPEAFGLGKGEWKGMPGRVLTTLRGEEQEGLEGLSGEEGVGGVGWWSLEGVGTVARALPLKPATEKDQREAVVGKDGDADTVDAAHDELDPDETYVYPDSVRREYVYKLLSPREIDNSTLLHLLGTSDDEDITWLYRHYVSFNTRPV